MGAVLSRLTVHFGRRTQQDITMSDLPNELLLDIFSHVSSNDLNRVRLVDRRLGRVAVSARNIRAKPRYTLKIFHHEDNDEVTIRLQRRWRSGGETEALSKFDLNIFDLIDIDVIELEGLSERTGSETAIKFLNSAVEITSALNNVCELRLTSVTLPDSSKPELLKFFKVFVPQCMHVFVRDCLVPIAIPADIIAMSNRLRTFKWSQSFANEGEMEMNAEVLRLISFKLNIECTTVELTDADYSDVFHIFQQWMIMSKPTHFSLTLLNRTPEWQSQLLAECTRAGYHNFQGEFEHPGADCAHIKVMNGRHVCQLLPVLNVPAKSRDMPQLMARWFRN